MKRFLHIKLILLLSILLMVDSLKAQENTIHAGEWFVIKDTTKVYILGNFTDSANSNTSLNKSVLNLGEIYLKGNLYNQGTKNVFGNVNQSQGTVVMNGTSGREISGNDSVHFHNLYIDLGIGNELNAKSFLVINDSLYMVNGRILLTDSISLYHSSTGSDGNSGIIDETNENRIHGPQIVRLDNYIWGTQGTYNYQNLKNIGIAYNVEDYLGATPFVIIRENVSQECGPSTNSVERTFTFLDIPDGISGEVSDLSILWHDDFELGNNFDGDSMHIYRSSNIGDTWEDIGGDYSNVGEVFDSPLNHNISKYSWYTVAKDSCDVLPNVQIGQIITTTSPHDTLFGLDTAMACNALNPDAQLLASGDAGIYTWTYPDNSTHTGVNGVSFTPDSLGQYILTVQDIRGCVNHDTIVVDEAPEANADFTLSVAGYCANSAVIFTPDEPNQTGYTYEWTFGDGNTGNVYSASNTYITDGSYFANLTVTTDQGCIKGSQETVVIHPIPVANFTSVSACPGEPLTLQNNSTANAAQPVSLFWDIESDASIDTTSTGMGDGSGGDVDYIFTTTGLHSVTLTATSNGCTSTPYIANVEVYPVPVPDFSYTNACEGQNVNFTNLSNISDASALTYSWNFNGSVGPYSTLTNPSYPYSIDGTYAVTLTATSTNGCVASYTDSVTVDDIPVVSFSTTDVCVNNSASFGATSTVPGATWNWSFGDANTGSGQNTTNLYTTSGTYSVNLTVTTAQGCIGTTSNNIVIFPGPTVGYSALSGCLGTAIAFQNITTNATSYSWNFPTLTQTSSSFHESRTFNSAGYHEAILTATSSNGCVGSYTDSVEIYALPVVSLGGPTIATCGTSYLLDANPGGINNGSAFFWTTGATASTLNATYNGSFGVTVTSANGCVSSDNATVTLNSAVVPNLGSDRTVCDIETLDAGYSGATYSWSTGATTQTINVTTTGTYSVSITDQNGCVGSNSVLITVTTSDPVNLGANQQTACQGETILLDAGNPGNTFLWNTGATTQTINVTQDGYYSVEVTNVAGCVSGDTVGTVFYSAPVVNLGSDAAYCVENTYNVFTANASYEWSDASTNSDLTVTSSGIYWVDVTNLSTGCTTRDSVVVTINPLPVVNLGNDTVLCSYESITLDAGNSGSAFLWNTGALSQTTTVFATGAYSVEVTDANGCENDDQINVTINSVFSFDLGPDRPFCSGSSIVLDPAITPVAPSYNWYDENGQLATTSTFTVPDTGVIYLQVTDQFGCVANDSITILPSSLSLYAVFLADSKVQIGDTIQFVNLSYPKPYDSYWEFGNGAFTTDSMPTYTYFVPGDYDVTLTVDNGNCQSELTKTITIDPVKSAEPETPTYGSIYTSILDMLIYPNPNDGQFTLRLKLEEEAAVEVQIFNMTGQLIHSESFVTQESERKINFQHIRPGMYLVRARVGKESRTEKFIKIYAQ